MSRTACCLCAIVLAFTVGCGGSRGPGADSQRLIGGGSSLFFPLMTKWMSVYDKERGIKVDYTSSGSSNGVQQMIARTIDFGCSDAPMNAEQIQKAAEQGGDVLHVPLVMGAIVPIYNLADLEPALQ